MEYREKSKNDKKASDNNTLLLRALKILLLGDRV